jgi:hypothetical protein
MTKEELSSYYYLKKEIKQIEERIKEIDDTFLSANRINGMRYEKRLSNPQEQRMILIEKYDKRLEEKKDEALKELMKIEDFIDSINDPEIRMIFRYRYIELMEWNKIAMLVNMSERTVYRKHREILNMAVHVS